MRFLIDLVENYLSESIAMQYSSSYNPKKYPIFKNGNRANLFYLLDNLEEHGTFARALLDGNGNLYFWDAYAAVHFAITRELGLSDVLHLELYTDHVNLIRPRGATQPALTEQDLQRVTENRNLQRIYGSVKVNTQTGEE